MSAARRTTSFDMGHRINDHVGSDGSVSIPRGEAAEWLYATIKAAYPYERRLMLRESNPTAYAVILALRIAAETPPESWPAASDLGTKLVEGRAVKQDSEEWLTTRRASEIAGVTDRAIRDWIATNRLPARRHGHTWRIHRTDLQAATHAA